MALEPAYASACSESRRCRALGVSGWLLVRCRVAMYRTARLLLVAAILCNSDA